MIDVTNWPIVWIGPSVLGDAQMNALETSLDEVLNRALRQRQRVVLWVDPTRCTNVDMNHVVRVARMMNRMHSLLEKTVRCSFIVVQNKLWRKMFGLLFSLAKPVRPLHMVDHPSCVVFQTLGRLTLTLTEGSSSETRVSKQ